MYMYIYVCMCIYVCIYIYFFSFFCLCLLRQRKQKQNIERTLFDINHSNIFSDPPPRVMEIKTKINKLDLMNLQNFCTAKETINNMKRQPSEWEKIFANEATDKGLIYIIYKQLMQLNIKKQTTQSKNGQKT